MNFPNLKTGSGQSSDQFEVRVGKFRIVYTRRNEKFGVEFFNLENKRVSIWQTLLLPPSLVDLSNEEIYSSSQGKAFLIAATLALYQKHQSIADAFEPLLLKVSALLRLYEAEGNPELLHDIFQDLKKKINQVYIHSQRESPIYQQLGFR